MSPVAPLFEGVRRHGLALAAHTPEPAAELLALVWGSRFDRDHAHKLLQQLAPLQPETVRSIMAAADTFDRLPRVRQQRIRMLIAQRGLVPVREAAGDTIAA